MSQIHGKIIVATSNPHKRVKLGWIIEGYFDKTENLAAKIEVEEDGSSFKQNAEIKARFISQKYMCYAIATDGGVLIPSLGKNWNELLTRRFLGKKKVTDKQRIDGLLELMKGKKGNERKIIWKEAIAVAFKNKIIFSVEVKGDWGLLQETYQNKQYKKGIWICTLWSYPQFGGKNFFDLNEQEKMYGERSWWILKKKARKFLNTLNKPRLN